MNYLIIASLAYLLNAVSVTIDKVLLEKRLPNPLLYVFYISLFSLTALLAAPFAKFPSLYSFLIASFSTLLWTGGAYFMFRALKGGDVVRVIPVIGTLIPIILLSMSAVSGSINSNEITASIILVLGLIFLVFPAFKGKFSRGEIYFELISAFFFANSYFLLKIAYNSSNFFSIFVYSKLILLPLILSILVFPVLKKIIFSPGEHHKAVNFWSKTGFFLFLGQASGGASHLLLTFAISLANPAVINSIQGIQYVFIFLLSIILIKKFPSAFGEKFSRKNLAGKIIGIVLIFFGLWLLSFGAQPQNTPKTGLTFSPRYAVQLNLDPSKVYTDILKELNPKVIRLPLYWDEVEKTEGKFDFSQTEELIEQALKNDTKIILVAGFKQPRWPECYQPDWSKDLSPLEFDTKIIELVKAEVSNFKKYPNITHWQVENEPFVDFGICPKPDPQRLDMEIEAVRNLDNRPVLITDSGELSTWRKTMKLGDVFGTTLYRSVWSPIFGSITYPWPPITYKIKHDLVKYLTGNQYKPSMIAELQAEPWLDNGDNLIDTSLSKQIKLFPNSALFQNYKYAGLTDFDPILFWGAEWWYFMKEKGVPGYWDTAKVIFNN